jgi:chorismate dehydratase
MVTRTINWVNFVRMNDLNRKIRIAAVSYLNTKPLTYGLQKGLIQDQIELTYKYPSLVAHDLIQDNVDIALLPVAMIPQLSNPEIVSDFCIGTTGEVASVCLFSDVPLHEIETILLDYQSRTSVALLKILMEKHWKIKPTLLEADTDFEKKIHGKTAGLVIGDRAFVQRNTSTYSFDLGLAWKELTGLPFVFAVWLSNKKLPNDFIQAFNLATGEGLSHLDEIVQEVGYDGYDLKKYYTENIDYHFNEAKKESLNTFLKLLPAY